MDIKLLELYSDYIISSFGQITATGLSRALSGSVSHDKITRFLAKNDLDSKQLWQLVKPVIRDEEQEDGVLIVDDTIEKKPHTTESELICWHHDHQSNRSVKGINIINYIYSVDESSLPVGFDVIRKPIKFCEVKTKKEKRFARIDSLSWSSQKPVRGWFKGLDFPVQLHRQVFTNKDGSTGILYLACSDFNCDVTRLEAIYKKRWKVEVFHKTLKSNTGLAKSPTKCVRTQTNHIFMSIYATFQLECLKLKHKMNHFALRSRIYIRALQHAMLELQSLKSA